MGCITKKLRGYGFVAQMTQLPIVAIQRVQVVRSKRLFNVRITFLAVYHKTFNGVDLSIEYIVLDLHDPRPFDGKSL